MIKNELKSVLRNKNNLIYIITFSILFVVLNISLNVGTIIDNFFDKKIDEHVRTVYQEYSKINGEEIELEKIIRTIQTTNGKELEEEQKQKLKKMEHVQAIERQVIEMNTTSITINYIIVDDWKNCEYIQKYLDNQGIDTYVDTIGIDKELLENYKILRSFSEIIKYVIIIISIAILTVCCKNIVKNEEENLKLLNVFGYKRNKIKNIIISQLLVLLFIGLACGCIIYSLFFGVLSNNYEVMVLNIKIITNIIIALIPVLINTRMAKIN